jgi:hypothetical protein
MTRAEWTPKSLSAGKATYGTVKRTSQTNSDDIRFIRTSVQALGLNGLQNGLNIRKQRLELEVLSAKGQWLFAPGQHTVALAVGFPLEKPWEEFSGDLDEFIGRNDLSEATARQILCENPCRLYGLSKEKLSAHASEQKQSAA